jgi:hypothetical protein
VRKGSKDRNASLEALVESEGAQASAAEEAGKAKRPDGDDGVLSISCECPTGQNV